MVYTNTVPSGHMRNPGEAQTAYAVEAHTELIARQLGIDSFELRRRNATARPRHGTDGSSVDPRIGELLDAAAAAIGWETPRRPGTGRGIALAELATSPGVYSAALEVHADGSVVFHTPIVENGAGMLRAFGHMVSEELAVPPEAVTVAQSFRFTFDRGVGGSRVTRVTGLLLDRLAKELRVKVAADLAARYGEPEGSVTFVDGAFRRADGEAIDLLRAVREGGTDIRVEVMYEATPEDSVIVHSVQAVEVEVDSETGAVRPIRVVAVHEAGRIINRRAFEGQIEGGIVQGMGYALMEGLILEDGRVANVNLHEYKIPVIDDVPALETIILLDERLGITPIGEGTVGMAAAVANAVLDVVGPRPLDLPITPEAVLGFDSSDGQDAAMDGEA
jgi:CO/xanthine dehydrogenase Mo-binding subunit